MCIQVLIRILSIGIVLLSFSGPAMSETKTEWATRIFDRIYAEKQELMLMGKGVLFVIDPAPIQQHPAYVSGPVYCTGWEPSCKEKLYHSLVLHKEFIKIIPSDDALAFVIYHELAHIFLDHTAVLKLYSDQYIANECGAGCNLMGLVEQQSFSRKCKISDCLFTGGEPSPVLKNLTDDLNDIIEVQEREADGQALSSMAIAGLDGRAGADFLRRLDSIVPKNSGGWDRPRDRARYILNCLKRGKCDFVSLQPKY